MEIRTRIKEMAHERGFTAAQAARENGFYRSNLSSMDAGKRSVSLHLLGRLSETLGCSLDDLIETVHFPQKPIFKKALVMKRLLERDLGAQDGSEKRWLHQVVLAWKRHYASANLCR